jgi:hypothetical protein
VIAAADLDPAAQPDQAAGGIDDAGAGRTASTCPRRDRRQARRRRCLSSGWRRSRDQRDAPGGSTSRRGLLRGHQEPEHPGVAVGGRRSEIGIGDRHDDLRVVDAATVGGVEGSHLAGKRHARGQGGARSGAGAGRPFDRIGNDGAAGSGQLECRAAAPVPVAVMS